jgi:S1-C subfamily serine protease
MKRGIVWSVCLVLVFPLCLESIPSDFTPFVRLGHLVKVSVYKNPVLAQGGTNVINNGQLVREEMVQMPVGSGTVISAGGLILTNYHVYNLENNSQYDALNKILYIAEPVSQNMLVYQLKDNDPLKVPDFLYIAAPVSLDEDHDTALLKIVADNQGNAVDRRDFSSVSFGNPFGMTINESLYIIGYPGKGGDTLTITDGKFLGYYRDSRYTGLDGFIKTNAAMAPGNSGGAALNDNELIGVPTSVTLPGTAGADLGYIHPVTWALKVLTIARIKYELDSPEIPIQWLINPYNSDETARDVYVTGSVISAQSGNPLDAQVIVAAEGRTFEEIQILHQKVQSVMMIFMIKQLSERGISSDQMASRFEVPQEEIEKILSMQMTPENLDPDVVRFMQGEFIYRVVQCDREGFFILSIPRGVSVRAFVYKTGFRRVTKNFTGSTSGFQNLGKISLFQY